MDCRIAPRQSQIYERSSDVSPPQHHAQLCARAARPVHFTRHPIQPGFGGAITHQPAVPQANARAAQRTYGLLAATTSGEQRLASGNACHQSHCGYLPFMAASGTAKFPSPNRPKLLGPIEPNPTPGPAEAVRSRRARRSICAPPPKQHRALAWPGTQRPTMWAWPGMSYIAAPRAFSQPRTP